MPLAQSSELPPPRATMESTRLDAANTPSGFHHAAVGVGVEVVEAEGGDAGLGQEALRTADVAGGDQPRVGHEERPGEAQLGRELAQTRERAGAEHDARTGHKLERLNDFWGGGRHETDPAIISYSFPLSS